MCTKAFLLIAALLRNICTLRRWHILEFLISRKLLWNEEGYSRIKQYGLWNPYVLIGWFSLYVFIGTTYFITCKIPNIPMSSELAKLMFTSSFHPFGQAKIHILLKGLWYDWLISLQSNPKGRPGLKFRLGLNASLRICPRKAQVQWYLMKRYKYLTSGDAGWEATEKFSKCFRSV